MTSRRNFLAAAGRMGLLGTASLAIPQLLSGCTVILNSDPKWELVHDFDLSNPPSDTGPYRAVTGQPKSDDRVKWEADLVDTSDDGLVLNIEQVGDNQWEAGAVSFWPLPQKYGRYEVTFRSWKHDVASFHMLLWPESEEWPPEIDMVESFNGDRQLNYSYVHYNKWFTGRDKLEIPWTHDVTDVTTVVTEWTSSYIRVTVNDKEVAYVTDRSEIPHQPMWFGLQAETHAGEKTKTPERLPVVELQTLRIHRLAS